MFTTSSNGQSENVDYYGDHGDDYLKPINTLMKVQGPKLVQRT